MDEDKKLHQQPLSIEEQIENLKELGLVIDDEEKAKYLLNDISYFRLIKAYSIGLKPKNGKYFDGITFDQIVELYMFNADFRQLLFAEIEQIEVNLRYCKPRNRLHKTVLDSTVKFTPQKVRLTRHQLRYMILISIIV